jgi:hypothetical protein
MCEKTMIRGLDLPGRAEEEILAIETVPFDDKRFLSHLYCHRCQGIMSVLPVMKRSGPRYVCEHCGRIVKMDHAGKIWILKSRADPL